MPSFSNSSAFLAAVILTSQSGTLSAPAQERSELEGRTIEEWARVWESDQSSFRKSVTRWGTDGTETWISLLDANRPSNQRQAGLEALECLFSQPILVKQKEVARTKVVPVLRTLLQGEKRLWRGRASNCLRQLGLCAEDAVPDLIAILEAPEDPDAQRFSLKESAANTIAAISVSPEAVGPALRLAMQADAPRLRMAATKAFGLVAWRAGGKHRAQAIALIESAKELRAGDLEFEKAATATLAQLARPSPLKIGDRFPEFALVSLSSAATPRRLDDYSGRLVVLDFWSITCPSCQPAMSKMEATAKSHPEWKDKVALVGISVDDSSEAAAQHTNARGWTTIEHLHDPAGQLREQVRGGLPETLILDQAGKLIWRGHPIDADLESAIPRLLSR